MEELIDKLIDWLTDKSDEVQTITRYGRFMLFLGDAKSTFTEKFRRKKETTPDEQSKVESQSKKDAQS